MSRQQKDIRLNEKQDIRPRKRRCINTSPHLLDIPWMDMVDFLPDATMAINLKGEVIAWNRAMEEMTGIKAENIMGRKNFEHAIPFCGFRRPILIDYVLKPDYRGEAQLSVIRQKNHLLINEVFAPLMQGQGLYFWCKAGPLYDEAGNMIGAIESVRDVTEIKRHEEDLQTKAQELRDLNTTLRVLLKQRNQDRNELEDKMLSNIKLLIEPFLEKLKPHTHPTGKPYLKIIEANLEDITSSFASKLSFHHTNLTNKEIQIANLIKEGKTTKEISEIITISVSAVNVYRHHIRRKLGLTKKQNLTAYLSSLPEN